MSPPRVTLDAYGVGYHAQAWLDVERVDPQLGPVLEDAMMLAVPQHVVVFRAVRRRPFVRTGEQWKMTKSIKFGRSIDAGDVGYVGTGPYLNNLVNYPSLRRNGYHCNPRSSRDVRAAAEARDALHSVLMATLGGWSALERKLDTRQESLL